MHLQLDEQGYMAGITALRTQIQANGSQARLEQIAVTHPDSECIAYMYINLAYSPDTKVRINGSLYTVAFGNTRGTWCFNVGNIGVALPGVVLGLDGSYANLGYDGEPPITYSGLLSAIEAIANNSDPYAMRSSVALLIIAVNEAIRFDEVAVGVNSVFDYTSSYPPPMESIRNWGGHSLGS